MTPDIEPEYYKGIDDHFFDGLEPKPSEEIMIGLSRFEKCKAGHLRAKTMNTKISTLI
jgi:hypothetical protein